MRTKELVNMMKELSDYQKDRIETIMNDFIQLNDFCETKTPTACPNCGKIHKRFIKKGFANKKQRYQCKECGKKFVYDKGQLTYHSQQTADIWADLISDTLQMNPISYTAAKLNLSTVTIFYMRHKFLTMLETLLDSTNTQLEGYTELDECYINDSYKGRYGSFKEFPSDRKPRKHGACAIKRGISNEKICINCGADRDGHVVIEASN